MTLQKKGGGLTSNDVAATLKGLTEIELQMGVHLFYWDFLDKNVWGLFNNVYSSAVTTITGLLPTFMSFNKTNVQVKLSMVYYCMFSYFTRHALFDDSSHKSKVQLERPIK